MLRGIGARWSIPVAPSWRTGASGAPYYEPLVVRIPNAVPGQSQEAVAMRTAQGWRLIGRAGRIETAPRVLAWTPVAGVRPFIAQGKTPNHLIMGAGKSGTTSLFDALRHHHDIHAAREKEPTFFVEQFQVIADPLAYFRLFDSPKSYRMEASHAYFSNPSTARTLKSLFPDAKFILTLRDPKRRAHSLFRHMRRLRHAGDGLPLETIADFAEALRAEPDRAVSPAFRDPCRHYLCNFLYARSSRYDLQIERYRQHFDPRQFHILTLAELRADPPRALEGIARFLDIDPAPFATATFPAKNTNPAGNETPSEDAMRILDAELNGVTERMDEIAERKLDWSL